MSNYFQNTGFVSNSDLSELRRLLNLERLADLTAAFNFGHLLDAMVTEKGKVNHASRSVTVDDSEVEFEHNVFQTAERMRLAAEGDSTLGLFLDGGKTQHEYYRKNFRITYLEEEITLPVRAKLDFVKKQIRAGADLKSTACSSQSDFNQTVIRLDYHRQAAWYMDIADLDYFIIAGIGKKRNRVTRKHPVFKFAIQRGDDNYIAGQRKYSWLGHKYYYLIHQLQQFSEQ